MVTSELAQLTTPSVCAQATLPNWSSVSPSRPAASLDSALDAPLQVDSSSENGEASSMKGDGLVCQPFPQSEEDYISKIMDSTLTDLSNDARLPVASSNPGMGLLLSLSEKLAPRSDEGSVRLSLDDMGASSSLSSARPLEAVTEDAKSAATLLPTTLSVMPADEPLLGQFGFDHNAHLDSIASAATAAAATQFQTRVGDSQRLLASVGSLPLAEDSAVYLDLVRQASMHVDPFREPELSALSPKATVVKEEPTGASPVPLGSASPGARRVTPSLQTSGNTPSIQKRSLERLSEPSKQTLLHENDAQQNAIEETVCNLNVHHTMAQHAALQHRQQKLETALPKSAAGSPAKRPTEAAAKDAKRIRVDDRTLGDQTPKRFQCPQCSRAFARAYNLNTHLSTHDPDPNKAKPFSCPYRSCKSEGGRSFSRKHDLQRHVASVHEWEPEPGIHGDTDEVGEGHETGGLASLGLGTPGKKFRCAQCGRAFVRRDALRRHQCDKGASSLHGSASSRKPVPYAVRGFPGEVVQQVALQLMAEAEHKHVPPESLSAPVTPQSADSAVHPPEQLRRSVSNTLTASM